MARPDFHIHVSASLPDLEGPWEPLSGGRTNQVWRAGNLVIKKYAAQGASLLFPNDPIAEAQALAHFGPLGMAPTLVGQGSGWIAYDFVLGTCWREGAGDVARLLGRVHSTKIPGNTFRQTPIGSQALRCSAVNAQAAVGFQGDLPDVPDVPVISGSVLHGDAVPANIVRRPNGDLCLIDWQCPAIGDPADDLAIFLSPAMQMIYRGFPLSSDESTAFLNSYPDHKIVERYLSLRPLYHFRMAMHCLSRANRGEVVYADGAKLELAEIDRP